MGNKLFSLYYINLEKVYELKMIRNNFIQDNRTFEKNSETRDSGALDAGLSAGIKGLFSANSNANYAYDNLKSVKVSDTFVVKQAKSNIFDEVFNVTKEITCFDNIQTGELICINDLSLKLENEQLVRIFKLLSRDIIKGQVANGIDINKTIGALAKDYSYLLSATLAGQTLLIKIPMAVDSEFESKYSIDDLLIGKVSLVGIYKGKVKGSAINSNFDFFVNLGELSNFASIKVNEEEIQSSSDDENVNSLNLTTSLKEDQDYIFIDLLAVLQGVHVVEKQDVKKEDKGKKNFWRFLRKKK